MISDNHIISIIIVAVSGIVGDIYRRFKIISAHNERITKIETLTNEQKDDIKEMKDDIKYLVRKEISRNN